MLKNTNFQNFDFELENKIHRKLLILFEKYHSFNVIQNPKIYRNSCKKVKTLKLFISNLKGEVSQKKCNINSDGTALFFNINNLFPST